MKIAIIGGGARCWSLMNMIGKHTFQDISPEIVAVADINEQASGLVKAQQQGLHVTNDYGDILKKDDIDLIIELTGKNEIYNDILKRKKDTVRALHHKTALLFWEISYLSNKQRKTKHQLEQARLMNDLIFNESIHDELMLIGPNRRIIDVNKSFLKNRKLKKNETVDRFCYEINKYKDSPCIDKNKKCPLIHTLKTKKHSQSTHTHQYPDGTERHYSISCYPIFDENRVVSVLEMLRDITDEINFEKTMMQQEKLASIGRLSAGVAHEINNPLTTILTTAMLWQEDIEDSDPIAADLKTIVNETLRCREIVQSLLNFARQTKTSKNIYSINDIVRESIILTKKQAAFKDVLLYKYLAEEDPLLYVDKGQIQQSLINLSLNAIEATNSGGNVTFTTKVLPESDTVEIVINDTGYGIENGKLGNIFEPFFTTKDQGTGLGLSITHGIIEEHNGTITVSSQIGKGTSFTIILPMNSGGENEI